MDLWLADPECLSLSRRGDYLALCDAGERARYERITHDETRDHHLLTRALVRTTLSRYAPIAPEAWRFTENEHGCPFIAEEYTATGLHFNVSHTHGLIVCAVTRGRALGVDIEYEPRDSRTTKIADRFFAPAEVAALHRLPEAAQRERFFCYWTLKEAYIKARGMGLAIPLKQFWFDVEAEGVIDFETAPELNDDPSRWSFLRLRASADHPLALAIRGSGAQEFTVRSFRTVPLGAHEGIRLPEIARST
ncbi:MAG: 4'-phosphopantetheinyl transferase family protein [Myxococcota bacterium]